MYVNEFVYEEPTEQDLIDEEQELREFYNLPPDYQFAKEEDELPRLSRAEYLKVFAKEDADNPEIRYVYFNAWVSPIYSVYDVIKKMHREGISDVTKVSPCVINICANEEINAQYCIKAVDYFNEHATEKHGDDAFDEYIGYILENKPIEIAFDMIYKLEGWDEFEY